ncbi:MAG: acetyl-CoA carboxylase biotin carboxyl carrier protein subunit [Bdellovibrionota bacterium]
MSDKVYTLPSGQQFELKTGYGGETLVKRESTEEIAVRIQTDTHLIDHQTKRVFLESAKGRSLFWVYSVRNKRILSWPGGSMELDAADLSEGTASAGGAIKPLRLTMPGKVLSIKVKEGDTVEVGQALLVVEAMKMENLLLAIAAAKITKIHVQTGDRLESGATLITFEALA